MLKKLAIIFAILYTIGLLVVCLMSLKNMPQVNVSSADKIFHLGAYAVFTLLWFSVFFYNLKWRIKKAILSATLFAVTFGIIIEVLQDVATDYRAMDVYDVMANTTGALIMALILWQINKIQVKNR